MREIYLWTEWFPDLAKKISDGGERFLVDALRKLTSESDGGGWHLLRYGAENIDPFSFICSLARQGASLQSRERVYPRVRTTFEIEASLPLDREDAFLFASSHPENTLFHAGREGTPELLWRLFKDAVSGPESVDSQDFEDAASIADMGIGNLTAALFLINPTAFLPYAVGRLFGLPDRSPQVGWAQYREDLQKLREAFPRCATYEIGLLGYLCKNGSLLIGSDYYQVSTNVWGPDEGDYWDSSDQELDFAPNHWVCTGGPGSGVSWTEYSERKHGPPRYPLRDPQPGDLMLVRTGVEGGRGIGVVYRNDYQDHLTADSKIHVLWVNKESGPLPRKTDRRGLNRAGARTLEAFQTADTYAPTFALLDNLRRGQEPMPNQTTEHYPVSRHPLNQILYGPPGTGKTFDTVDRALAIIDGDRACGRRKDDIERLRALQDSGRIEMVTFHQNFAYEDFIEGIRPVLDDRGGQITYELRDGIFKQIASAALKERGKRFVLIIDEINRGNIAKIFGELITLIEDSRRLGRVDETIVKLPYSMESFGVPSNLYLIGTMNTADRSIQLLDTALRRRFDFVEMMPKPDLISASVEGVDLKLMLETMNSRITAFLDRERQIGHTYLLDVKELPELSYVFQNRIFPLLQEYFFDDWGKVRAVLGANRFVQQTSQISLLQDEEVERTVYWRLPDNDPGWAAPEEYKKIYRAGSADDTIDQ